MTSRHKPIHLQVVAKTFGENSSPVPQASGASTWREIHIRETSLQPFSATKGSPTCDLKEVNLKEQNQLTYKWQILCASFYGFCLLWLNG